MRHRQLLTSGVICGTLLTLLITAGCRREEPAEPPPTTLQSEAAVPTSRPVTTVGCLLAGETANTYMLMAARDEGGAQTKNYQLVAGAGMDLQEHVGERVRVSGTVEMRQAAQTQTFATPAETEDGGRRQDQPAGTAGETPMVQTKTSLAVDSLSVEAVSPLGERCGI